LLLPARFVKVNGNVRLIGVEVRRRIIECDVSVFTDADERDVDRARTNRVTRALYYFGGVSFAVQEMRELDAGSTHETILQKPAEAGWMAHGNSDVLIEMEELYFRPVDIRLLDESVEKFLLGGSTGRDDPSRALLPDSFAQESGGVLGGTGAQGASIFKDCDFQFEISFPSTNCMVLNSGFGEGGANLGTDLNGPARYRIDCAPEGAGFR
jgi:hypothetical protein